MPRFAIFVLLLTSDTIKLVSKKKLTGRYIATIKYFMPLFVETGMASVGQSQVSTRRI